MSDEKGSYEHEKWRHEQNRAAAERAHDVETEFGAKANDAAVASGIHAIRALLVINGGAAIAMLAFIGQVTGVAEGKFSSKLSELTAPLSWFALGVALAAAGTAFAYFTNYCTGSASSYRARTFKHPYVQDTAASRWWFRASVAFQVFAVLAGIASLVMFLLGMNEIRDVIQALK